MILSLAQLGNIGSALGGLVLVMILPLSLKWRGTGRLLSGAIALAVGWIVARSASYGAARMLDPVGVAERTGFADWLMWPSFVDGIIYLFFAVLAGAISGAITRSRR